PPRPAPALADPRLLAAALAKVVELGPAYVATRDDLELADRRPVERERPLHAHAARTRPAGQRPLTAPPRPPDHDPLEALDAPAARLDHPDVHLHGVARPE